MMLVQRLAGLRGRGSRNRNRQRGHRWQFALHHGDNGRWINQRRGQRLEIHASTLGILHNGRCVYRVNGGCTGGGSSAATIALGDGHQGGGGVAVVLQQIVDLGEARGTGDRCAQTDKFIGVGRGSAGGASGGGWRGCSCCGVSNETRRQGGRGCGHGGDGGLVWSITGGCCRRISVRGSRRHSTGAVGAGAGCSGGRRGDDR